METGGLSVSDVWRTVPRKLAWIYLFVVNLEVTDVMSEICFYKRSKLSPIGEGVLTTKDCQWGCCYNNEPPCCTAPISLIVGVALGGVLVFAVIVALVCCCCVCRKGPSRASSRSRDQARSEAGHHSPSLNLHRSVVFYSETSGEIPPCIRFPDDEPPSYEEVMRGEMNHAFKPETS